MQHWKRILLLIAYIAVIAITGASCSIMKKQKTQERTHRTSDSSSTVTVTSSSTVKDVRKDTSNVSNVTTIETDVDTSIKLPGSLIEGKAHIKDGEITLPDGSSIKWNVSGKGDSISIKASTPSSLLPIVIKRKQTIKSNTVAVNSHSGLSQTQEATKSTVATSAYVDVNSFKKTKEKTVITLPVGIIIACIIAVIIYLAYRFFSSKLP